MAAELVYPTCDAQANMANTIKLEIVTPEGTVYSEPVEMVTVQGSEGQMGILPNHMSLVAQLTPGEMIVQRDGRKHSMALGQGILMVSKDLVSVLTDMAIPVENIDEAQAEEARQRAAARLAEKISDEEVASVNASLAKSLAQLHVKRRRRG
jgi:F-type H+-transporting ATPase subunit epsilon